MRKIFLLLFAAMVVFPLTATASLNSFNGFVETDYGVKLSDDNTKNDSYNFLEQRLQLRTSYAFEGEGFLAQKQAVINLKGDFTVDEYYNGKTGAELRELNMALTPFNFMDVKAGRQVLTWGTGDYLFINDMFPKDYESFFLGRDDEYLKKPSDALKLSFYPEVANIDFIVMKFEPNTIATGDRLSFFDSFQQGIAGRNSDRGLLEPPAQLSNNEYALRVYRNFNSNELAFYVFQGFDKNPTSYKNEANRQLYYRRLDAYGTSLTGPFFSGIGNLEFGYWNSREDDEGTIRTIENSFFKGLAGYNKDFGNDLRIGFQYLYEERIDYENYKNNLLPTDYFWDEYRHVLTQRITKLFKNQTVNVSIFNFYSPSDNDGYFRPSISYELTDQWKMTVGANIPWGEDDLTEFGQMKRNKNVYMRVRYSF